MIETRKLMCILAHPDDETLGTGGTLAKYAEQGVEITLLTATRGERGWTGDPQENPGTTRLGQIREKELRAAAASLGINQLLLLNYIDGELDQANPTEIISSVAFALRYVRPQVVITFDPLGVYGHPDHVAISQFAIAGVVAAASPGYQPDPASAAVFQLPAQNEDLQPHTVSKVYTFADTRPLLEAYQSEMGELRMEFDGIERRAEGWPVWGVTAEIDITQYWDRMVQAAAYHQSQIPDLDKLRRIARNNPSDVWGMNTYYRLYSLVNGGKAKETDLFEGL